MWLIIVTQKYRSESSIPETLHQTGMPSRETRNSRHGEFTKRHLNKQMHVNNIYLQFRCTQLPVYSQLTLTHSLIHYTDTCSTHLKALSTVTTDLLQPTVTQRSLCSARRIKDAACHLLWCFLSIPFRMQQTTVP